MGVPPAGSSAGWGGAVLARSRAAVVRMRGRLVSGLRRAWNNPLLHHARRLKPFPLWFFRVGTPAAAAMLSVAAVISWAAGWRLPGAILMALSVGAVLAPAVLSPVIAADRVSRQMRYSRQDPRRLTDIDPHKVSWGLVLVALWGLRWAIVAALVFTPVLVIGVLRLDVSGFSTWRASAQVLGAATPGGRAAGLLPGGRIPYIRLVVRALSAGLLPWAALPLLASLGVTAALRLDDLTLSPLAALLGGGVVTSVTGLVWHLVARTPLLGGMFEIVRVVLLGGLLAGLGLLAERVNRHNAALLVAPAGGARRRAGTGE